MAYMPNGGNSGKVSTGPSAPRGERGLSAVPLKRRCMSCNASAPNSTLSGYLTLKQHSAFHFQRGQQFVQRMREGHDAIGEQSLCDYPQVDTQFGQASQSLFGVLLSRFECCLYAAVITECVQRRGRNGIDGMWSD